MTENRPPDPRITTSDYRTLLGEAAWSALHPDIRDRFHGVPVVAELLPEGFLDIIEKGLFPGG